MSRTTDKPATRFGAALTEWNAMVERARDLLVTAAAGRRTVTYGELSAIATELRFSARSAALMALLDEAAKPLDERTGTVMATLVVRKDTGRPGEGYFAWWAAHGIDVIDHEALWLTQARRVWDAYASNRKD